MENMRLKWGTKFLHEHLRVANKQVDSDERENWHQLCLPSVEQWIKCVRFGVSRIFQPTISFTFVLYYLPFVHFSLKKVFLWRKKWTFYLKMQPIIFFLTSSSMFLWSRIWSEFMYENKVKKKTEKEEVEENT